MALSADTPRNYAVVGTEASLPVQASSAIYAGSALTIDTGGEVGPLATGEVGFVGFAIKGVASNATAGGDYCRVMTEGVIELAVTGINDNNDIGDIVYATDDNTFTLTASGAVGIGKVLSIDDTANTTCLVEFKSLHKEHWND